jgi:hypothetical protein
MVSHPSQVKVKVLKVAGSNLEDQNCTCAFLSRFVNVVVGVRDCGLMLDRYCVGRNDPVIREINATKFIRLLTSIYVNCLYVHVPSHLHRLVTNLSLTDACLKL